MSRLARSLLTLIGWCSKKRRALRSAFYSCKFSSLGKKSYYHQNFLNIAPNIVVYLTFTLMYGGIITHSFSTCKLHLKSSGKKSPTSVVNYPWKALWGVNNKIYTFTFTLIGNRNLCPSTRSVIIFVIRQDRIAPHSVLLPLLIMGFCIATYLAWPCQHYVLCFLVLDQLIYRSFKSPNKLFQLEFVLRPL